VFLLLSFVSSGKLQLHIFSSLIVFVCLDPILVDIFCIVKGHSLSLDGRIYRICFLFRGGRKGRDFWEIICERTGGSTHFLAKEREEIVLNDIQLGVTFDSSGATAAQAATVERESDRP
jgi:hypothetical protein